MLRSVLLLCCLCLYYFILFLLKLHVILIIGTFDPSNSHLMKFDLDNSKLQLPHYVVF